MAQKQLTPVWIPVWDHKEAKEMKKGKNTKGYMLYEPEAGRPVYQPKQKPVKRDNSSKKPGGKKTEK